MKFTGFNPPDIVRDSPFGRVVRLTLGPKIFPYVEERPEFDLAEHVRKAIAPMPPQPGEEMPWNEESSSEDEAARNKECHTVTWYGEHDPANPINWSWSKKIFSFVQICMITFAIYSASSIITPAEEILMKEYHTSKQVSLLVLSMYVLGYGAGPLFFSPISEIPALGRNVPYITSFFLFICLTAVTSRVHSYPALVVTRFLQGFLGGPVLATGGASAADIFGFLKLPYGLAAWAAFAFGGPAIGPVMSTYAITEVTWRYAQYETLMLSGGVFAVMLFFLPETNAESLLLWRAQRLRTVTGRADLQSESEQRATDLSIIRLMGRYIITPFKVMLLDPSIAFANFYTALLYGVYYSWFESFPIVFGKIHHFSTNQVSLVFIAVIIGGAIGCFSYWAIVYFFFEPYTIKNGIGRQEVRLIPGLFASVTLPIGIFIFGWTGQYEQISWVVPCVGIAIFSWSSFYILQCIFLYLPTSYPRHAASILTMNAFLRSAFATGAIHFAVPMFNYLGVGKGNSVLGGLLVGCGMGFYALWYFGAKLRARSKFTETH